MSVFDYITKMSGSWFNDEDEGINILRGKKRDTSPIRKQKSYYNDSYLSNTKFEDNLKEKEKVNTKKIFYIGNYDNDNNNINTNIINNEPKYENINNIYYRHINKENNLPLFDHENDEYYNENIFSKSEDDINENIEDIYTYIFNTINTKIKNICNYYCKIE